MSLPLSPLELEAAARAVLDDDVYDYYASGAGGETSVAANEAAWAAWHVRPRVLVDVREVSTATTVLGTSVSSPVLLAPCACNGWADDDGERAVARAAATAGTVQIVSSASSVPADEVAAAAPGPKWFQLYVASSPEVSAERVRSAVDAGYRAIVVTVDAPVGGLRRRGLSRFERSKDVRTFATGGGDSPLFAGTTWDHVDEMVATAGVPIVLKGVLHPADVGLAAEHGVGGVIVSNHGGRQIEGVIPTAVALPDVVEAAAGRVEVYVDGGIRSGVDVLRALALGARAALVGRPYLWALAVAGEAGVVELLENLRGEVHNALALTGQVDATAVAPDVVAR